jgi:hypothetical protein
VLWISRCFLDELWLFAEFHFEEELVFLDGSREVAPGGGDAGGHLACMIASKSTLSAASCSCGQAGMRAPDKVGKKALDVQNAFNFMLQNSQPCKSKPLQTTAHDPKNKTINPI